MREFWSTIQLVFTAVGGWLGWFLGGSDGLLAYRICGYRLHNGNYVRRGGQEAVQFGRIQRNMQKGAYFRLGRRWAYT